MTGCKSIFSRYPAQGVLRPIGLISSDWFGWLHGNNIKIVIPKGTNAHWVHPWKCFWMTVRKYYQEIILKGVKGPLGWSLEICFTVLKEIITREFSKEEIRSIGLISWKTFLDARQNLKRVGPGGTKAHWVNPSQFLILLKK